MPQPTRIWKPSPKCPRPTRRQANPNPRRRQSPRRQSPRRPGLPLDASFRRPSDCGSRSSGQPHRRRPCQRLRRRAWCRSSSPERNGPGRQAPHGPPERQAPVRRPGQSAREPPVLRRSRCRRGPVGQAPAPVQRIRARAPRVQWEDRDLSPRSPSARSSRACRHGRVSIRNGQACRVGRRIGREAPVARRPRSAGSRRGQWHRQCRPRRRRSRARSRWPKA
jgi:hypothetical protein